ncbi:MAG: ATP-dependent DNA helicase RecG [Clostridia bacterium]|nr:ATP-dependent DNA helicase RecG [Clostridia bacterium]
MTDVSFTGIRGLGPARLRALAERGITNGLALIEALPVGYRDSTNPTPIAQLGEGAEAAVRGFVVQKPKLHRVAGRQWVSATIRDDTGTLRCMWFGQPWMRDRLAADQEVLLCGRVTRKQTGLFLINPALEEEPKITPVYRSVPGLPAKTYRALVGEMLARLLPGINDPLPEGFRARHRLCGKAEALALAHQPTDAQALARARRRLAFESLLLYQAALTDLRRRRACGVRLLLDHKEIDEFWSALPFAPTGAQRRVLAEICADIGLETPMARMVQGDVGCGKTAIAFGALALCAKQGWQGVLMAPTEILAIQHYRGACALLEPMGIRCGLLTGALTAAQRRHAHEAIATGEWQVVIGTHALISQGVRYARLGLVITDEQHRFGVRQRSALAEKGEANEQPNVLVLSATPIPRSLALVLYGDLDISVVDELPPGRTPVVTRIVPEHKRADMYGFLLEQAQAGRQIYIVCPLVEETEEDDEERKSAEALYAELTKGPLKELRLGLVHGQLRSEEKEAALSAFAAGDLDALVATTVIEVGVNVPNATVMVIENADRFGLAQLHQLRGRVGRGAEQSWCFLLAEPNERLELMTRTQDGFVIAQKDLELRGAGEFFGTRQHGRATVGGLLLDADAALLEETQRAVKALREDPALREEAAQIFRVAGEEFARKYGEAALN